MELIKNNIRKLLNFIINNRNELIKSVSGSASFAIIKILFVWIIEHYNLLSPWLAYVIITTILTFAGYVYHSKITFKRPLSFSTLNRYIQQVIGLIILENLFFNFLVYILNINPKYAVILNSGVIYLLRLTTYFKYVFKK